MFIRIGRCYVSGELVFALAATFLFFGLIFGLMAFFLAVKYFYVGLHWLTHFSQHFLK